MDIWNLWFCLLQLVFPIRQTDIKRRERPLDLLCLGLPRSGTQSLARALRILGYRDVYHGQEVLFERIGDAPQWLRLAHARQIGASISPADFDPILGKCDAVTDVPCILFAEELMQAYPEAKVLLNRRRNAKAWKRSMQKTMFPISRRRLWDRCVNMWHPKYAWVRLLWMYVIDALLQDKWLEDDGRMVEDYERHYERLKAKCEEEGRVYLEWYVEDGWPPLCEFLGKGVPDQDFPAGNTPSDPGTVVEYPTWPDDSKKNMALASGTMLVGVVGVLMRLLELEGSHSMIRTACAMSTVFVGRWIWQACS